MTGPAQGRLPLTVISGYLGAGKTTLINRLLSEDHGLRMLVMVNDFGAINIDAALLAEASDDTLTLSNGCVCCTMGADLFMAIGDVLDRPLHPDHLVIEASGVADPARIAQVAQAEPDLIYGGIATVVDGPGYAALSADAMIGAQVRAQVRQADLLLLSKLTAPAPDLMLSLGVQARAEVVDLATVGALAPLLFGKQGLRAPQPAPALHPAYLGWSDDAARHMSFDQLATRLAARPEGLFRFKGFVTHDAKSSWEVHCVGPTVSIKAVKRAHPTQVVAIGLRAHLSTAEIDAWWSPAGRIGFLQKTGKDFF